MNARTAVGGGSIAADGTIGISAITSTEQQSMSRGSEDANSTASNTWSKVDNVAIDLEDHTGVSQLEEATLSILDTNG